MRDEASKQTDRENISKGLPFEDLATKLKILLDLRACDNADAVGEEEAMRECLRLAEGLVPRYKRAEVPRSGEAHIVLEGATFVAGLAAQCAQLLDENDAQNYMGFQIGPSGRPVYELVVQRIGGFSPLEKNARLMAGLQQLRAEWRRHLDGPGYAATLDDVGRGQLRIIDEALR